MDNLEKLAPHITKYEEKQNKSTAQYVLDITMETNTNNVNKTWTLLQTTGGKDDSNIVILEKPLYYIMESSLR